ncbi:MAG: helix-turn-helix transcriptional regulator [Thermoguttaceae bacterium]|nr:helix-turn-helix transcriptional regulator [Thermoguttaceae bacterium]
MKNRLILLRETLGYNQSQFAKLIPLVRASLSRFERGEREMPDYYVELICVKFNVNKEWLLHGEGEMFAPPNESEQEIAEKFLLHKIHQLPEDCKKELLNFCIRLLKAESKNF